MASDWTKSVRGIQCINTRLNSIMSMRSRAIIHHVEKYYFLHRIWSQNLNSYCFFCNFAKFCRFCVVCSVLDLVSKLWMLWYMSQQNMEAYHVCNTYPARAISKCLCFDCMYWSKLMNLCCFVWCFVVLLLFSLFFWRACTQPNILRVLQC